MIRIGILGAARTAPAALLRPARLLASEICVTAVAARDPARAREFARRHGIPRTLSSYQELVEDPELDAVYNPLPNSLHAEWTIRALQSGKHVLCEKPLACNAAEASRMNAAALAAEGRFPSLPPSDSLIPSPHVVRRGLGRGVQGLLMEAFHYRYHPLIVRVKEIVDSGELGRLRRLETHFCAPLLRRGDIRYQAELGGGATMDLGCYCIHLLRLLTGIEPEVTAARARLASPQVDRAMQADFRFSHDCTARMTCALFGWPWLRTGLHVRGDQGELRVLTPFQPHLIPRLKVRVGIASRTEHFPSERSYTYQLRAFIAAVQDRGPVLTPASEAVANMRVIDAVYLKAGLKPRGT